MRDFVGLHSWGLSCPLEVWCERMDALAAVEALVLVGAEKAGAERKYGRPGTPSISFYLDQQQDSCQTWGVVTDDAFTLLGQDAVARLFFSVASAFRPILARSFNELGHGVIKAPELDGALEFIDWFQYLSPDIVARLGTEALSKAPDASVEFLPSGACVLWLPGSPIDVLSGRRAIAEALGISLRPLIGKNPKTVEPIVIPWA